jgi:enolase 1/2/3
MWRRPLFSTKRVSFTKACFLAKIKQGRISFVFIRMPLKKNPFVIIEDLLEENDYEDHAIQTTELGIEIVGDDLFTTNIERLKKGIEIGAANTVLLKVNQIGTISEAFDMVQLAYHNGYGIMPYDSRGEGADIADYAVGLSTGHIREGAIGPVGNRLLQIEAALGNRAQFWGRRRFKL